MKRHIQNKMGTTVNLTQLRKKYLKHYHRLYEYGSPPEVIKKWGLDYEYDYTLPEEKIPNALEEIAENGAIVGLPTNNLSLYETVEYYAKKSGMSAKEYVESLGFKYLRK